MASDHNGGGAGAVVRLTPSSIPSCDQNVWADASPLIDAACKDLQDGELVHGENFSLFAAMSALEIMDPKMDSGIERSGYYSIEEAIEDRAAPIPLSSDKTIDIQCTLDVMDHLFSCEATWHKGATLAQTVFSCIYLLRVERTSSHALLHSYCRIMRATCSAVISAVSDARTHEEEDIFVMAFGLPLRDEGDEKCLSILNSVEETISRQLRACKAQPSNKKKQLEEIESLQSNPDLEEGYCRSVLCRLRFRKHFYHLLMAMRKPQGKGLDLARKHIASCLSELDQIRKSVDFIKSQPHISCNETLDQSTTASGCRPVGFDPSLNTRVLSPTPPRAAKILSWRDAVGYFEKLLRDLDVICATPLDPVLENVLHFVVQFQKSQPDLVARAYLQLLLVQDGKLYGRDSFCDVISRALLLPELAKDKQFQTNQLILQLGQLLIQLLKILCTNTAWQRRKLGKSLNNWSLLHMQFELACSRDVEERLSTKADEVQFLHIKESKSLLLWTQEQTYWIAARFLTLGFELDLYSPGEYCMVYWYLSVVFMQLLEKMQLRAVSSSTNFVQRKGKKKKDHSSDFVLAPSSLLLQCYSVLSEGLAMMLAALCNEINAFKMLNTFNREQERFFQHFELLLKARIPEHTSFSHFLETTADRRIIDVVKCDYFRETQRITASLKGSFSREPEKLVELRKIEQVAEHNRVAVNEINQLINGNSKIRFSLELTHHPYFAVVTVKGS